MTRFLVEKCWHFLASKLDFFKCLETRSVKVMKVPSSASSMVSAGLQETLAARLGGVM